MKATEISTEHPKFDSYIQMNFKNWLYQYVSAESGIKHNKSNNQSICQHTKMELK